MNALLKPAFAIPLLLLTLNSQAESQQNKTQISGGFWMNYAYDTSPGADNPNNGFVGDEAIILYIDGQAEKKGLKSDYSFELQFGPGGYTDPDNNSTGTYLALHKGWIGFYLNEHTHLKVGKSQVPFGWKTTNFWGGDMFQAGYGDQMDVGLKLSGKANALFYDLAYFHQDDWGATSTDTTADNKHWGSSDTYRKVQTLVGRIGIQLNPNHKLHAAIQSGRLQNLIAENQQTSTSANYQLSGDHQAAVLAYEGQLSNSYFKAEVIQTQRNLPALYAQNNTLKREIENRRYAFEIGHVLGDWEVYLDSTLAESQSDQIKTISAHTGGIKYDYGPGWIYLEYLTQNGYFDRNGQMHDHSTFSSWYLTLDAYF